MKYDFQPRRKSSFLTEGPKEKLSRKALAALIDVGKFTGAAAAGTAIGHYTTKGIEKGEKVVKEKKGKKKQDTKSIHFIQVGDQQFPSRSTVSERDARISNLIELQDVRNLWREPIAMSNKVAKPVGAVVGGAAKVAGKGVKAIANRPKTVTKTINKTYNFKPAGTPLQTTPQPVRTEGYDPKSMAEAIRDYFDRITDVFAQVIEEIKTIRDPGSAEEISKLKDILTKGILDYRDPMSYDRMLAQLQRASLERVPQTEGAWAKVGTRLIAGAAAIGAIWTGINGILMTKKLASKYLNSRKLMKLKMSQDRELGHLFDTKVIPELSKVITSIVDKKITTVDQLGVRMFPILEKIYTYRPELEKYLTLWKPFNS